MNIIEQLLAYEADPRNPADGRRVIRDERCRVQAAMQVLGHARAARARAGAPAPTAWSRATDSVTRACADHDLAAARNYDPVHRAQRQAAVDHDTAERNVAAAVAEAQRTLALWS